MSNRNERARCVNWAHPMAPNHLPPKSPSLPGPSSGAGPYPGCIRAPNFVQHHRRSPSASFVPEEPSWVEELLDSPKAPERRAFHRRSASDSFTFLEAPSNLDRIDDIAEENESEYAAPPSRFQLDHERDQLASMLMEMNPFPNRSGIRSGMDAWHPVEDHVASKPNSSSLVSKLRTGPGAANEADHRTHDTDQGPVDGEGDASAAQPQGDNTDPKRSKRQSAQRSRVRKLQYIAELEANVAELQNEVTALSAQVTMLERQRLVLHIDNTTLKQNYAALAQERRFKDAHTEALRNEVQRLRLLQQHQRRVSQQLSLATSTAASASLSTTSSAYQPLETKHLRRASASSISDMGGSASEVLDSFVRFVERTDSNPAAAAAAAAAAAVVETKRLPRSPSMPPGFAAVRNH